jgi:hypothetical protein
LGVARAVDNRGQNGDHGMVEKGNAKAGLTHIGNEHENQFLEKGIKDDEQLADVAEAATTVGKQMGTNERGLGGQLWPFFIMNSFS